MAPYSEDSMYYRASIQSIHTNQRGNILATVQFSGFAEDENEQVNVRCLKKRPARLKRDGNGKYIFFFYISFGISLLDPLPKQDSNYL